MIEELRIRDLGVIAEAVLPLGPGLTVVTGETGAGKTMVVTALGLLLGERADGAVLRAGADSAAIEGRWLVSGSDPQLSQLVTDAGGFIEDGELVLARTLAREGRSRALVGGRSTPVAILQEVGARLVVVHGQSDQLRLRSRTAQREALDRTGGVELEDARRAFVEAFERWRASEAELSRLSVERDDRAEEAADLRAAIERIEAVAPRPGEDAELAAEADRLTNVEALRLAAAEAYALLTASPDDAPDDAPDATTLLDRARRAVERVAGHDQMLQPVVEALEGLVYAAGDVAVQLAGYLDTLDTDGGNRLEVVQSRRAALNDLIRLHGPELEDVIALLDIGSARLLELDRTDTRIGELEASVAAELSETCLRRAAAERLAAAVTAELAALAMPDARLVVEVSQSDRLGPHGRDEVSLLLAPHPGAEPRPIGRGASGGELSRIMLAIEVVIGLVDPLPTFVFDEVDAGVGGAAAIEIGRRLARLAEHSQVIVVTHLAQVAAFATNHLRVRKDTAGEFTASSVERLIGEDREREMARLLSGLEESDSALAHARELLELG